MGKGSTTSQTNVTKKQRQYSSDAGAVAAAAGGSFDHETANACLISFSEKIQFSEESGKIKTGIQFIIISGEGTSLQIMSGSKKLGKYAGRHAALLRQCMAVGYIYRGTVQSVETGNSAVCVVTGLGKI